MILTNQQHRRILFLCIVSTLCSHSPAGRIVLSALSASTSQKVKIKYVACALFRFCAVFAVHVINSLWSLNYCLESKGFWKICCPLLWLWCLFNVSSDLGQSWMGWMRPTLGCWLRAPNWKRMCTTLLKVVFKKQKNPTAPLDFEKGPHQLRFCAGLLKLGLISNWRHWLILGSENIPWPNVWLL